MSGDFISLEKYRVISSPMQLNITVIIGTLIELNQANKYQWTSVLWSSDAAPHANLR